jgi:DNA-binding IclR family transcriptional regulator
MLRTRAYIGQHMPLYCSAMGKIYMAFGHADYVESTGRAIRIRFSR